MPTGYDDLLVRVLNTIQTISLEDLKRHLEGPQRLTVIDVRERDEYRRGCLPGAIHLPRGVIEMEIERTVPDKATPIVVYCASGARAAFAARTLLDLGYPNVKSASPGFSQWKSLGFPVEIVSQLSDVQRDRYARHLALPEVGESGQLKLIRSKVLLVGLGGLGSSAGMYLAAAGVGTLGLVDADVVETSNLQRQVIHPAARVGTPKVESAAHTLRALNPDLNLVTHRERIRRDNVERILRDFEVVVDGSDNFATRYLLNDAAMFLKKPVVHASVFRFEGQATTLRTSSGGPCYRCLYPEPPTPQAAPSCTEAGVLGVVPGIMGLIQATEVIKLLLGLGDLLIGRLLNYDAIGMKFREYRLDRNEECALCGDHPSITDYVDYEDICSRG